MGHRPRAATRPAGAKAPRNGLQRSTREADADCFNDHHDTTLSDICKNDILDVKGRHDAD